MSFQTDTSTRGSQSEAQSGGQRTAPRRRPFPVYVLLAGILFQGVSGIAGGIGLLMDPTGESLGIPLEWLAASPFPDYTLPGAVLLVVLGIFPLVVFYGLLMGRPWGLMGAWLVGLALLVWLFVEILVIGYQAQPPLQLIYGVLGVLILAASILPAVRRFYRVGGS